MNSGFRLVISKKIQGDDRDQCLKLLAEQAGWMPKGYGNGGYRSYYKRGVFGIGIPARDPRFAFRRLTTGRRIFGVVPVADLEPPVNLDQCCCPDHRGGERVRLKEKYSDGDFDTVFETGDIKG